MKKQNQKENRRANSHLGLRGSVTVHAPATIANLVCGFDVLGLALNDPCDVMTLSIK